MANFPIRPEGGSGGGLGHSNMTHWTKTEEIKKSAKKSRRRYGRHEIEEFMEEFYSGMSEEEIQIEKEEAKRL